MAVPTITGQLCPPILEKLNSARASQINPFLHSNIPSSIPIGFSQHEKASAGCILPNPAPFGPHCICSADAEYAVSLNTAKNLNSLQVTNFSSCGVYLGSDSWTVNLTAKFSFTGVEVSGGASAGCQACGIHPKVSGSVTTHAATADGSIF